MDDSIDIVLGFDRVQDEKIFFDMEIANRSSRSVLFAPEALYAVASRRLGRDTLSLRLAIDPEEELLEFDKNLSREKAQYAEAQDLKTVGSVIDFLGFMVGAVARVADKTPKTDAQRNSDAVQTHNELQAMIARNEQRDDELAQRQDYIFNLAEARRSLELYPIRKTTLDPQTGLFGKVAFPLTSDAAYYTLYLPVGNSRNLFTFRQHIHGDAAEQPVSNRSATQPVVIETVESRVIGTTVPATMSLTVIPEPVDETGEVATVKYDLSVATHVNLKVYDARGGEMATLVDAEKPAGQHRILFKAQHLPRGTYTVWLRAAGYSETKQLEVIR